jgi:translation initiation factor IF-1
MAAHALKRTHECPILQRSVRWAPASRVYGFSSNGLFPVKRSLARSFIFTTPRSLRGSRSSRKRRPQRVAQRSASAPTESFSLQSFDGFGLDDAIARAVAAENYAIPTSIQVQTIPTVMSRRDGGHEVVAYAAGPMKKNRIKTLAGDRVTLEVSPCDLAEGRLIFRHNDERPGSSARPLQRNDFRRR